MRQLTDRERRIVWFVGRNPGATYGEIAQRCELKSNGQLSHYIRRLRIMGVLEQVRGDFKGGRARFLSKTVRLARNIGVGTDGKLYQVREVHDDDQGAATL